MMVYKNYQPGIQLLSKKVYTISKHMKKPIGIGLLPWRKVWQAVCKDKEFSRPATSEDLKRIIKSLNDQGAEYLLIGGYALYAYGYHRATDDIDLLLPRGADKGRIQGLERKRIAPSQG
jgi:hypothetical protein